MSQDPLCYELYYDKTKALLDSHFINFLTFLD